MTKGIKKVTTMLLGACLLLAAASTGHAQEMLIYEHTAEIAAPQVVMEAPATETIVYAPSEPQQASGNENQEKWYSVSFHDLEGNEIWYYSLREGEAVYSPDFIPYWNGLVFQFWFDVSQAGSPSPFLFGEGIHRDMVLVPYYLYEQEHFISAESIIYSDAAAGANAQEVIAQILTLGSEEALGGTVVYPDVMPQEATMSLIESIISGDEATSNGSIAIYPEIMSDEVADQIIADILWDNAGEGDAKVVAVEAAYLDLDVEQIIADILWVEPVAEVQPEQQAVPEDAAEPMASDILYQDAQPEAAAEVTTATQPKTLIENADQVIWQILGRGTDEAEEASQEQAEDMAEAITFEMEETPAEAPQEQPVETVDSVMTEEQVQDTIADIIYGSIQFSAEPEQVADKPEAEEEILITDTVTEPEEGEETPVETDEAMSGEQESELIDSMLGQEEGLLVYAPELAETETETDAAGNDLLVYADEAAQEGETGEAPEAAPAEESAEAEEGQLTYEDPMDDLFKMTDAPYSEMPWVEVGYSAPGEIIPGTEVTLTATVHNVDPSLNLRYQWENNASGTYQTVPFAVGRSYTFIADDSSAQCDWRVSVTAE